MALSEKNRVSRRRAPTVFIATPTTTKAPGVFASLVRGFVDVFMARRRRMTMRETLSTSNSDVLVLSARDSRAFVDELFNPSEPNEKLREAYALYKQGVVSRD